MLGISILALALFVTALIDILRSQHLTTRIKAVWVWAALVLPFLGPVVWFLVGHRSAPSVNESLVNSRY
ncbi:PLDc N-terminal domain-containing protein [Arthrobacter sp. CAN_C5]|uniref:PLDc N-terminal domain-containing protein n=1 Tax=Arthrobacter sp. CAN_C5 TaxID=2760706 RepID=UPI001AE6E33D|nr:hypothetical protein [Arthrobacter sp. CAN_C5]